MLNNEHVVAMIDGQMMWASAPTATTAFRDRCKHDSWPDKSVRDFISRQSGRYLLIINSQSRPSRSRRRALCLPSRPKS